MCEIILFSIIIPIYNCENYIENCLNTILASHNDNYEVICIDDGSSDHSASIIQSIEDTHIHYYHKENGGVSSARNMGISLAKGKYISFVDADDYVTKDYVDTIISNIINQDYDLLVFNHYKKGDDIQLITKDIHSTDQLYMNACYQYINAPWDKVFKREIINNNHVEFNQNMKTSEDEVFFIDYLRYVNIFKMIDQPLYYYRLNENGAVANPKLSYINDQVITYRKIKEFIDLKQLDINKGIVSDHVVERLFYTVILLVRAGNNKEDINELLKNSQFFNEIKGYSLSIKSKIKVMLLKYNLYDLVKNRMK